MRTELQVRKDLKIEFDKKVSKAIRNHWRNSRDIGYLYSQYQNRDINDLDGLELHEMAHYLERFDLKKEVEILFP